MRRALVALAEGSTVYSKGESLYGLPVNEDGPASGTSSAAQCMECTGQTIALRRPNNCSETDYHWTIGPPGSEMELIHKLLYWYGQRICSGESLDTSPCDFICVCVCAYVRACVCACVRACVSKVMTPYCSAHEPTLLGAYMHG